MIICTNSYWNKNNKLYASTLTTKPFYIITSKKQKMNSSINITFWVFDTNETNLNDLNVTKWYIDMEGTIRIPLYALIFLSGLIGNVLVILTLARNRRLRIVTNVFLLNLAVSDLLLGVFCMPITLVGTLLREFVFGQVMCKIISYIQGKNLTPFFV